ncbi:MAG TPA: hypothetical protein DCG13_03460 [Legionellales bacterium]|nr:hypothetical protein [Legionellales bacterium]
MNILGLINTLPNEKNLGDCFPGDVQGSYSERIAHIFTQEIFSKATHCIEIKTGALNADSLPQIYCDLDNEEAKKLAKRFAAPVISHVNNNANSFRKTAYDLNIPLLVYKAGEAMRFNEDAIKMGITGIENMLDSLDMITLDESLPDTFKPVFSLEQDWVRAHCSGILMTDVSLGQFVEKNQEIAQITDPFSADTVEPVRCPQDGIIVAINRNPLMSEGQNIIKMASFIDNNRAELTLEQWNKIQQED